MTAENTNVKTDAELIALGIRGPRVYINYDTFKKTPEEKLALKEAKKEHKKTLQK